MADLVIFGAKSIALGVCLAVRQLYAEHEVKGFLVSDRRGNPLKLAGLPVWEVKEFPRRDIRVLIAVPEHIQGQISDYLKEEGFSDRICIDSAKEASLMERYYRAIGRFPSVRDLGAAEGELPDFDVYVAKFYKDQPLRHPFVMPSWTKPIQAGAALTAERVAELQDSEGDNISVKNPNYCELTALYWMWKNGLKQTDDRKYFGLYHYRRILEISEEDRRAVLANDVDVILPFPMVCEPNIEEHHSRYVSESDWRAMREALARLEPEYAEAYAGIFAQPYMYNYNILIAKRQVLSDYCAWLFPILERVEELSEPKGRERQDRYIGYLGENLLTLYFMYHQKDWKIYHAGRILLV